MLSILYQMLNIKVIRSYQNTIYIQLQKWYW